MNVYKKLQTCRAALKKIEIKESGNNRFAGYTYMELGDFLPHITGLCEEHGLCSVISFADLATLTIINSDKPEEQIVFTSPMSTAELKGCHAIQNLGAVETYLRRYLYVTAFEIVEHDALDSTQGKTAEKVEVKTITSEQEMELRALTKDAGATPEQFCATFQVKEFRLLPEDRFNEAKKRLEKKAAELKASGAKQ